MDGSGCECSGSRAWQPRARESSLQRHRRTVSSPSRRPISLDCGLTPLSSRIHAAAFPLVDGACGDSRTSQQNRQRIIDAPCGTGRSLHGGSRCRARGRRSSDDHRPPHPAGTREHPPRSRATSCCVPGRLRAVGRHRLCDGDGHLAVQMRTPPQNPPEPAAW